MKLEGKKQKYILIGGLALLLAGVVYWNYSLNAGKETEGVGTAAQGGGESFHIESMSGDTLETSAAGEDYFESFRTEREYGSLRLVILTKLSQPRLRMRRPLPMHRHKSLRS